MVAHIYNPGTLEAEAGESEVAMGLGGRTDEMAQQLRAMTFSEGPRIHTGQLKTACDFTAYSGGLWRPRVPTYSFTYPHGNPPHTHTIRHVANMFLKVSIVTFDC